MPVFGFLMALFLVNSAAYAASPADYNGYWWTEDRSAIFELIVTQHNIEGITRWAKEHKTDSHNPDPALQQRSLQDVTFLWGFTYQAKNNSWQNGQVYDPDNGKTYSANLQLNKQGDSLEMRGYIGIALFGRSAHFARVKQENLPPELQK